MALLHTVNKSPFERDTAASCLRLARPGGAILFIEDGVTAVLKGTEFAPTISAAATRFSLYALDPDLAARGFDKSNIMAHVTTVDYAGFVDLAVRHDAVHAWL